jgi:RNA polymerase sigma-70 factor, ECF subfamily
MAGVRRVQSADVSIAMNDAALLRRVAGGDTGEALEALYRRYAQRIYEFGLRLTGDRGLADELVQETFLRLWRTADRFDDSRGCVAAYLFTIARSQAVDLLRRPSSRCSPAEPDAIDDTEGLPDAGESMLTRLVVDQAIASLSAPHREVLILSYQRHLTQAEIAEVLGVPLGTVKTRSYYALRALKLALAESGIDD